MTAIPFLDLAQCVAQQERGEAPSDGWYWSVDLRQAERDRTSAVDHATHLERFADALAQTSLPAWTLCKWLPWWTEGIEWEGGQYLNGVVHVSWLPGYRQRRRHVAVKLEVNGYTLQVRARLVSHPRLAEVAFTI